MKLIVHPGLRKTGSSYIQHLLNDNHAQLAEVGVYYQQQTEGAAHHAAAQELLDGKSERLRTMLSEAQMLGCETVIMSSEDLEGALQNRVAIAALEKAARSSGFAEIEWHFMLRDPGERFTRLAAQLYDQNEADALPLFIEVMRAGMVRINAIEAIGHNQSRSNGGDWHCFFDAFHALNRFSGFIRGAVFAHDFAAESPFPGHQILESIGALGVIEIMPGNNVPSPCPRTQYFNSMDFGHPPQSNAISYADAQLQDTVATCLKAGRHDLESFATVIRMNFGKSTSDALEHFARPVLQPTAPSDLPRPMASSAF